MNQIITKEHLAAVGITKSDEETAALLTHLNSTLHERVGAEVVASLDDQKLKDLTTVQESGDELKVTEWINENVPELKEIIEDEVAILLGEIAEHAESLNAS